MIMITTVGQSCSDSNVQPLLSEAQLEKKKGHAVKGGYAVQYKFMETFF